MVETAVEALIGLVMIIEKYWILLWTPPIVIVSLLGASPIRIQGNETTVEFLIKKMRGAFLVYSLVLFVVIATTVGLIILLSPKHDLTNLKTWVGQLISESPILIATFITSIGIKIVYLRYLVPKISALKKSVSKEQKKDETTSVVEESKKYTKITFNPESFYKSGYIFIGLDFNKKPIYIPLSSFKKKHKQIIGTTGSGKGVLFGVIIDQIIKMTNNPIFYVDPKEDDFLPKIMEQAAKDLDREFVYISLKPDEPGRWGPFLGGQKTDARARFERAFGLESRGSDADYYKKIERRTGLRGFEEGRDISNLLKFCQSEDENSSIAVELELWNENSSLSCSEDESFSIADAILNKKIVYFKTDLDDSVMLKATSLFMLEIAQEGKRLKNDHDAHISGFFDEVSFYVSADIAERLATIRNSRIDFSLAYQSPSDMKNLKDRNINSDYVFSAINTNCQLKFLYPVGSPELAKNLQSECGTVWQDLEQSTTTELNEMAAEVWKGTSFVAKKEMPYLPLNTLSSLPEQVCVLKDGSHLAKICFTSFVKVRSHDQLAIAIATQKEKQLRKAREKCQETNSQTIKYPPRGIGQSPFLASPAPVTKAPHRME